jgi:hypothetical protein
VTQSTDLFRTLDPEESRALFDEMRKEVRPLYKQLEAVAAGSLKLRPVFLAKQPVEKRYEMMRKAMALRANGEAAAELLATFFLERYEKELVDLLDGFGVEHEEGVLKAEAPPEPTAKKIDAVVKKFQAGENPVMRRVLLKAFAAQSAIDWPKLDARMFPAEAAAKS